VLDVRLPGQSGLDLQRELASANRELPIIFSTGHGDIPMSVQAMKGVAIEFLTKPFRDQDLLDAIQLGLSRDRVRREDEKALADLRERFASLSPREREIVIQVARGRLSKQIAFDIGIACHEVFYIEDGSRTIEYLLRIIRHFFQRAFMISELL
jgi:FixJ family two-component response regulator